MQALVDHPVEPATAGIAPRMQRSTPPQQTSLAVADAEAVMGQSAAVASHQNIEMVSLSRLTPYANNARTHTNKQIRQIAKSIERSYPTTLLASTSKLNFNLSAGACF